jgi:peptide/nickel transport system permease protein
MVSRALIQPNWMMATGGALTGLLLIVAVGANFIASGDSSRIGADALQPPSSAHLCGTDDLGRDVFKRIIHGARTSLLVGLLTAGTAGIIGVAVGGLAGYLGGLPDELLMRGSEFVQVIPRFFLALFVAAFLGPSLPSLILLIGLTSWPVTAHLFRGEVLRIRAREYVIASRALGARDARIFTRAILPNALPPVIAQLALQVATAILLEAGLAFLGMGDPAVVSWGTMLYNAQQFMRRAWWLAAFPGLALSLAVLGVNLLGDGLTAAWTPRLRGELRPLTSAR